MFYENVILDAVFNFRIGFAWYHEIKINNIYDFEK